MKKFLAAALNTLILPAYVLAGEPSKASESIYTKDIRKATTSEGLTKADLAWHALNTYGWDCREVEQHPESLSRNKEVEIELCSLSEGSQLTVFHLIFIGSCCSIEGRTNS